MDKYMKLMAVKGLIQSLDEQLYIRFQKDNLPENVKTIIVDKYYDAINEQWSEPEKAKEDQACDNCVINVNGVAHAFHEQTISWEQVVGLTNLLLEGNEIVTVTYSHGDKSKSKGTLDVANVIKVKDGMIFNVVITSGA